ncbi:MAG: Bax inhibitor-1/YccA family protein, partial [Proteobacteria bacterium]
REGGMTVSGTVGKSFLLIALLLIAATFAWNQAFPGGWSAGSAPSIPAWYLPMIIGNLVLAVVIIFKKTTAPYLAPLYAVTEGFMLGAISAIFEFRYPGIAFQAVLCTGGVFVAMLVAYQSGLIRATENFKLGVIAATGGIALVYLIDLGLNFFGIRMPYLHENGMVGIGISLFVVVIAALNLVMDFDFIEQGAERGAPKYMEWYAAFGLLVTLVWLYLEVLRLISKTSKR